MVASRPPPTLNPPIPSYRMIQFSSPIQRVSFIMLRQSIGTTASSSRRRIQGHSMHFLREQTRKKGMEWPRNISSLIGRPFHENSVPSESLQSHTRPSLRLSSSLSMATKEHHFGRFSFLAQYRFKSTVASQTMASFTESSESPAENSEAHSTCPKELHRIKHIRNVGVFAHGTTLYCLSSSPVISLTVT